MQRIVDIRTLKATSKKIPSDTTELASVESNLLYYPLNYFFAAMFPFNQTLSISYRNERSDKTRVRNCFDKAA